MTERKIAGEGRPRRVPGGKPADDAIGIGRDPVSAQGPDPLRELDPGLRERAEQLLAEGQVGAQANRLSERDVMRLMHELQVHQIELEMQNEELRQAQLELALSAERYADLYDFAPVGYLSVTPDGRIVRANLTAAALLSMERKLLVGKYLHGFVPEEYIKQFYTMQRRLEGPALTEGADLVLQPAKGDPFWVRLEIVTRTDPADNRLLWQVAISNIDTQKRAEQMLQRINEELEEQVERRTGQLTLNNRQLLEEIDRRTRAEEQLREREELLERRVAERTSELAALLAVARDISSTLNIDEILSIILKELRRIVSYDGCGIFLLQGDLLTLVAYNGPLPEEGLLQSQTTLNDSPSLCAVVEGRRPVTIADMFADTPLATRWRETSGTLQRQLMHRSRAWMGIPMIDKGQVIGILRLDHAQPGYFTEQQADLVLTLASQAAIAVANARLYAQAQRVAALEERHRLARELHDSVAQTFYSIALAAHAAKAQVRINPGTVDRRLNHILDLADVGLTEMKALIFDLQAEGLRRDGLVQALRRHVDALSVRNDLRVQAELGMEPDAPLVTKEAVYGIAREALQNVVRHANATALSIKLSRSDNLLCLEVSDNGRGFSAETAGMHTLGLRSMQERAAAVGGSVEITSAPRHGALVRARIPIQAS